MRCCAVTATPRDTEREVAAMEHARAHGYPVPAARALSDTDIVMERVERARRCSTTSCAARGRMRRHAETLAQLHKRLHAIAAPSWLAGPARRRQALLHLDLHPDNVILGRARPGRDRLAQRRARARPPRTSRTRGSCWPARCRPRGRYRQAAHEGRQRPVRRRCSCATIDKRGARSPMCRPCWHSGASRTATLPGTELEAIRQMVGGYG